MIAVILKGGLGNQMFQYAAGFALADRHGTSILRSSQWFSQQSQGTDTQRHFGLDIYGLDLSGESPQTVGQKFTEKSYRFDPLFLASSDNCIIDGYFQSPKYFDHIREKIVKLFTPISDLESAFPDLVSHMEQVNSVAIHVRRGDYLKSPQTYEFHGIAGLPYYEQAIGHIRNRIENPVFFVFSDDNIWARTQFTGPDFVFIEGNAGDSSWMDMHLMARCKHAIIANSSFSWWGAYLNSNIEKIVLAPDRWFVSAQNDTSDLLPKEWIQVPNYSYRFSVIVPTYNRSSLLQEAVRSVLEQTEQDFEILVCDDGSTDDSKIVIRGFEDSRIRWIEGPHAGRPAIPRNRGIRMAQGEYVAFLDSDDYWQPEKLARQYQFMKNQGYLFCSSNGLRLVKNGIVGNVLPYNLNGSRSFEDLLVNNTVICSSAVVHESVIKRSAGFPEEPLLRAWEDWALWLQISTSASLGYIGEALVVYRDDTSDSIRKKSAKSPEWFRMVVLRHILLSGLPNAKQKRLLKAEIVVVKSLLREQAWSPLFRAFFRKAGNLALRIRSTIGKRIFRLFATRPASAPYVSGDGFRRLAHHIWDEWVEPSFSIEDIRPNDIVFISGWHMERFWKEMDPYIAVPYILVSHNGDTNVTQERNGFQPKTSLCRHWFAVNVMTSGQQITPIPIGIENAHMAWLGYPPSFNLLRKKMPAKINRILYGFSVENFRSERENLLRVLQNQSLADQCPSANPFEYRTILSRYKFVASPPGNGEDCHRTWEALYLRVVPIVRRSVLMEYFASLGIPVWIVDDWSEILHLNEDILQQKYEALQSSFDNPQLYLDFWQNMVRKI